MSSHEPGNLTTPNFMPGVAPELTPDRSSAPAELPMESAPADSTRFHNFIVLDQRVREQPLAHLRQALGVLDVELDQPPDVHVADPG